MRQVLVVALLLCCAALGLAPASSDARIDEAALRTSVQHPLHLYYTRQLVFSVRRLDTSPDTYRYAVTVWLDQDAGPDNLRHRYPWNGFDRQEFVDQFTVSGPSGGFDSGKSYRRGVDTDVNFSTTNATFLMLFRFSRVATFPNITVNFEVNRQHPKSWTSGTMRFYAGAGDYVLQRGDSSRAAVYAHYDRSQNDLPLPRPPYQTTLSDPRLVFNGHELVATSDVAYATMEADTDPSHVNVAAIRYVPPKRPLRTRTGPTIPRIQKPTPESKAASQYLGTRLRGLRFTSSERGNYSIDRSGIIRAIDGTSPGVIVGYLDPVSGWIYDGTPLSRGKKIGLVDAETRIAMKRANTYVYVAQVDVKKGRIFGPHGETLGKTRMKAR